jgi:hypothetical protein
MADECGVHSLMVAANPIGSPCDPDELLALYVRNRHAFAVEVVDRIIDLVPGSAEMSADLVPADRSRQ